MSLQFQLSRFDPLPKVICLPCDAKLEQHHRFIQRVIQNQKKIQGNRPIIPLLEQHLRVRVTENNSTYNIEALSSTSNSSSSSSSSGNTSSDDSSDDDTLENVTPEEELLPNSSSQSISSSINLHSSSNHSIVIHNSNEEEEPGLAGFNSELEPVNLESGTDNNDEFNSYG